MADERRRVAERRLFTGALWSVGLLALVALPLAGVHAGAPGVIGATVGLSLVAALFAAGAWLLALASRQASGGIGVLAAGAAIRLAGYIVILDLLSGSPRVDASSLALATAAGIVVTLAAELRLLSRMPELFILDADAVRRPATATRSESL